MSEENAPYVVTLKAGRDFDAPWIVVRGHNPDEVLDALKGVEQITQATVEAANFLKAANNAAPVLTNGAPAEQPPAPVSGGSSSGWANRRSSAPPPPPAAQGGVRLHPEGQQCAGCGTVLQFKDVFSRAKNKSFQFWACPQQQRQGDGHDSIFAN